LVNRPRGLRAEDVAVRAAATSHDVERRQAEGLAAAALVDQSLVGYFPRLSNLARYTRLSSIDPPLLGNVLVAPSGGPISAGNPAAVAVPLRFASILNQSTLQSSLQVPLMDYVLRLPGTHAAAVEEREAARWQEQAVQRQTRADARVDYYQWVR